MSIVNTGTNSKFFNPILVLTLIPIFDMVIYPTLERCNLNFTPLKRMTAGMLFAAFSFAIAAFVQIRIQDVNPLPPLVSNQASVDFINVSPCEVIDISPDDYFEYKLPYGQHSRYEPRFHSHIHDVPFTAIGTNCSSTSDSFNLSTTLSLTKGLYQSVFIDLDKNRVMKVKTVNHTFPDVDVQTSNTRVRTIYVPHGDMSDHVTLTYVDLIDSKKSITIKNFTSYNGTVDNIVADRYTLKVSSPSGEEYKVEGVPENGFKFGTFGAYTITLKSKRKRQTNNDTTLVAHMYEEVVSTSVHRIWQLPQYAVVSAGEVMFSVTGLEFAYSQAPSSMKSVLQSIWLVSAAMGDLIVVILAVTKPVDGVDKQMILYGCVMVVVAIIFAIMSYFYKYSDFSGKTVEPTTPVEGDDDEVTVTKSESTSHL